MIFAYTIELSRVFEILDCCPEGNKSEVLGSSELTFRNVVARLTPMLDALLFGNRR